MDARKILDRTQRVVRNPSKVVQSLELWGDYLSFRKQYGFLQQGAGDEVPGKTALIASLSGGVGQAKRDGMLAKALQIQGWTPVVLTTRDSVWDNRYFRAFGLRNFAYVDEYLRQVPDEVAELGREAANNSISFNDLYHHRYQGSFVGRHVLGTVVRKLKSGALGFQEPEVTHWIHQLLPEAYRAAYAAQDLWRQVQPSLALFGEKGYLPNGPIFDVLLERSVNIVQVFPSHRIDSLVFKRYTPETRNLHPFSLSEPTWHKLRQAPWNQEKGDQMLQEMYRGYYTGTWFTDRTVTVGKSIKTPEEVRQRLGLDAAKKTAVIYSHVLWDATFFFGENLFKDYEEWLIETVKVACQNTAVNWVIKVHPDYIRKQLVDADRSKPRDLAALSEKIGTLPPHVKVLEPHTDISTFAIYQITDYGITVRGTPGIEMACLGIPVFTAGTGRYSGLGFTIDSASREEYLAKMARIQTFPIPSAETTQLAQKYAHAIFNLRPLRMTSFQVTYSPTSRLLHPLNPNCKILIHSYPELKGNRELQEFAKWMVSSHELDLMLDPSGVTSPDI